MAKIIILPKLDEAMITGKIAKWLKKEGDRVEKGEVIVKIETEKVTFDIEAEQSGILGKIMAAEGEEVTVGTVIAVIVQPGEKIPEGQALITEAKKEEEAQIQEPTPKDEGKIVSLESPWIDKHKGIKASPLAKSIARENNINLARIRGTGPVGRIVRADVIRAIEEGKTRVICTSEEVAKEEIVPLSSLRKVIARRMTESFLTPHFYLTIEVETQELIKIHKQIIPLIETKIGIRPTITDFLIKMVAKALENNPSMNCSYNNGAMKVFNRIDIGLVISVEGGLIVPVIRQANKKTLTEVTQARTDVVLKAREGTLSLGEIKSSTFTISNLGMYGIDQFSAILQPPESAILSVGSITERPVVREGQIVIRSMMTMTLSIDHRVLDGAIGAQFLKSLKDYIENPVLMIF